MSTLQARLDELSAAATPGSWRAEPKRLVIQGQAGLEYGPVMCYLAGGPATAEGLKVSLASERIADHQFVAELVNAWREGKLEARGGGGGK